MFDQLLSLVAFRVPAQSFNSEVYIINVIQTNKPHFSCCWWAEKNKKTFSRQLNPVWCLTNYLNCRQQSFNSCWLELLSLMSMRVLSMQTPEMKRKTAGIWWRERVHSIVFVCACVKRSALRRVACYAEVDLWHGCEWCPRTWRPRWRSWGNNWQLRLRWLLPLP